MPPCPKPRHIPQARRHPGPLLLPVRRRGADAALQVVMAPGREAPASRPERGSSASRVSWTGHARNASAHPCRRQRRRRHGRLEQRARHAKQSFDAGVAKPELRDEGEPPAPSRYRDSGAPCPAPGRGWDSAPPRAGTWSRSSCFATRARKLCFPSPPAGARSKRERPPVPPAATAAPWLARAAREAELRRWRREARASRRGTRDEGLNRVTPRLPLLHITLSSGIALSRSPAPHQCRPIL